MNATKMRIMYSANRSWSYMAIRLSHPNGLAAPRNNSPFSMAMIPESLACEMSRNCNTRNNRETQKRPLVRLLCAARLK